MLHDAQLVSTHAFNTSCECLPVFSPAVETATGSQRDLCATLTPPVHKNI